jgi:hypothetical protein
MPASRADKIKMLLERHVFAEQLLLAQALEIHQIRECCTVTTPCRGSEVLRASIDKLHRETEEIIGQQRRPRKHVNRVFESPGGL